MRLVVLDEAKSEQRRLKVGKYAIGLLHQGGCQLASFHAISYGSVDRVQEIAGRQQVLQVIVGQDSCAVLS
ncbi:MAG: hypothetical protein ACP5UI_03985 [Thermoprotei archaeon]|nr:hypothetical protein [TACK group archaeon]